MGREKRPSEIIRKTFAFARRWQELGYCVKNIGIESVAYQQALVQGARDGVPEREATEHGEMIAVVKAPCPVRSITRSAAVRKAERILQAEPPISRREYRIWTKNPIGRRTAEQLKNFPMDRDDILDCVRDLWGDGIMIPPKPLEASMPNIHPIFADLIRQSLHGSGPKLVGTNSTVELQSW